MDEKNILFDTSFLNNPGTNSIPNIKTYKYLDCFPELYAAKPIGIHSF